MLPIMSMKGNDRAKGAHIFTYAPKSQEGKTNCQHKTSIGYKIINLPNKLKHVQKRNHVTTKKESSDITFYLIFADKNK